MFTGLEQNTAYTYEITAAIGETTLGTFTGNFITVSKLNATVTTQFVTEV